MKVRHNLKILPGIPYPLGVSIPSNGMINFAAALHSKEECGVLLYLKNGQNPVRLPFETGKKVGNIYCMQVEGLSGTEFQYNFYAGEEIITDPYAHLIYGNERWGKRVSPSLRGGFAGEAYDWEGDRPLMTPLSESILYLIHPRGFTRHNNSGVEGKGCFSGITEKIPYLKELGITAVELMPSYEFMELERSARAEYGQGSASATMDEARLHYMDVPDAREEAVKINYWGYKKGYYFAPKFSYSAKGAPDREFKDMVKELHRAGIEVVMQFYFPVQVKQAYILEVIRHWVLQYHVDGFHLMGVGIPMALLATDPMLGNTKLFYQDMPCHEIYSDGEQPVYKNLAVYNDGFMYAMRHFLKSDEDALEPALSCLKRNPKQTGIINYITNYSGFSLADLVSYDRKHNEDNGEENYDGESYNVSWNCGCEGKTRKKGILQLRKQQMRNAMLLLLTAQGTPMIVSGDEFGFGRGGNNNPYCQDNPTNWLNWGLLESNRDFFSFVKEAVALRKAQSVLHMPEEMTMLDTAACGCPDLSYHGEEAWKLPIDRISRLAGVMYCSRYARPAGEDGDDFLYIAYNMHWEPHDFALPMLPDGKRWRVICDTAAVKEEKEEKEEMVAAQKNAQAEVQTDAQIDVQTEVQTDDEVLEPGSRKTTVEGRCIRILQTQRDVKQKTEQKAGQKQEQKTEQKAEQKAGIKRK